MVVNCLFHRMKVKVFPIIIFAMFELSISAQPLTVRVAPYYQGRNAALSLTFDDGLQEHYTLLRPELNRRGLRGTFAIIGSKVGSMMRSSQDKAMGISGTPCMTWQMVQQLAADGHEIGSHGWEHKNVTKLPAEQLRYEVQHNDSIIMMHTGRFPMSYFYPGNQKDSVTIAFCERNRVGSRTFQTSIGSKRDTMWLRQWVDGLVEQRKWGIGMIHGITTGYDHFTDPQVLWSFLDYVVVCQNNLWVAPFSEVAAYVHERDNITLNISYKGQKVIVTPHCKLDPEIFHQPLTLIVNTDAVKAVHQGSAKLRYYQSNGQTLIDFMPNGGDIIIEKAQMIDELSRVYITPKCIVWTQGNIKQQNILLSEGTGQPDMAGLPACTLQNGDSTTTSILLDYGCELHGGLKLVIGGANAASSQVRIRFGESVGECCAESDGGKNRKGFASNDHATRDAVYTIPRYGQIEIGSTGFRFVRIDLLEPNRRLHLKEATAILRYRDLPYIGSFHCSDQRLDSIWAIGAYTVHLCMQEYLWDGIKRDRAVWLGDMHPEVQTIMAVFGQNSIVPKTLDEAVRQYPLPKWLNGISSYSLWYLIIHHDWYMRGADKDFLESHKDYIMGLIDKIDPLVDEDGTEHLEENTKSQLKRFLDWPSSTNEKGRETGYRALLTWAMRDAEVLCRVLNDKVHADKCEKILKRLSRKKMSDYGMWQAQALQTIAGLTKTLTSEKDAIARSLSTFYGYYMLEALAQKDRYDDAINIIRQYWGAMLDLGATTFWEDFSLDWMKNAARIDEMVPDSKVDVHRDYGAYCYLSYRHSLCHGWASGPTAWLSRHVLGVEIVDAGCRTLRITPHLGSLSWAEGTFPTPFGTVSIRHDRLADGSVATKIDAPKGIRIIKSKKQ